MSKRLLFDLEDAVAWAAVSALADAVLNGLGPRQAVVAALFAALRGAMSLRSRYRKEAEREVS